MSKPRGRKKDSPIHGGWRTKEEPGYQRKAFCVVYRQHRLHVKATMPNDICTGEQCRFDSTVYDTGHIFNTDPFN